MPMRVVSWFGNVAIFLAASLVTYLLQAIDRPISAVLAYLAAVILIAVRSGLIWALGAAVLASLFYNFVLSGQIYELGVATLDEAVPLVAFVATALATGILVGRLRDSAHRADLARAQASFLLEISDSLQSVVHVEDIEAAVSRSLPKQGLRSVDIFIGHDSGYLHPASGVDIARDEVCDRTLASGRATGGRPLHVLHGARGPVGAVGYALEDGTADIDADGLQSVTALLTLVYERCQLLEELAEAQGRERSEALKDALLSSVSHDLRTPITVIEAAAGALMSPQITLPVAEQVRFLEAIIEQCRTLDRFTGELLNVGKIEAGINASELEPTDLRDIVALALGQALSAMPEADFRRDPSNEPLIIAARATFVEQALANLLQNAAKYAGAEPIRVTLAEQDGEAVLSIEDSGPGIPEDDQPRIFDRFYRAPNSLDQTGSGLGLFIAKGFIEACLGRIEVRSPVFAGRGTEVVVTFPMLHHAP